MDPNPPYVLFTFRADEDALWRVYGGTAQHAMPLEIYLSRAQLIAFNYSEFLTLGAALGLVCCTVAHGPIGILNTRPVSSRSTTTAILATVNFARPEVLAE